MDGQRFDDLTRALARGASRRRLLKGLTAGVLGGAFATVRQSGMAADKVLVCHMTDSTSNPVELIEVSANAIPAHEAHGDVINPDFQNDPNNCGGCLISCDDGDPCTIDTCVAGNCVNTPIVCDDGNPCTDDACVDGECVYTPVEGRPCDDGNACTENDTCDATGACVGTAISCDDNNACTVDSCDPTTGCVYQDVDCDDGDACTIDSCDPTAGCIHTPVNCDDGDVCTADSCTDGTCVHTPIAGCCHTDTDCARGQVCKDNVCTENPVPTCAGESCGSFTQCSSASTTCVCATVVEGGGACVQGLTSCDTLTRCPNGSSDCNPGELCLEATCCSDRVCVGPSVTDQCPIDTASGFTTNPLVTSRAAVTTSGPTIGGF